MSQNFIEIDGLLLLHQQETSLEDSNLTQIEGLPSAALGDEHNSTAVIRDMMEGLSMEPSISDGALVSLAELADISELPELEVQTVRMRRRLF